MTVGYLIGSHVVYQHKAVPILLNSMTLDNQIDSKSIIVVVNGSGQEHFHTTRGIRFYFVQGEHPCPFSTLIKEKLGDELGIDYWFFLNCTSRCGPAFRQRVETGFNPAADATRAGRLLGPGRGCINDMAMYKWDYLCSIKDKIDAIDNTNVEKAIWEYEGLMYNLAPIKGVYPDCTVRETEEFDVYASGTMRITEYYPGIDLYRYKKNHGQLASGSYKQAAL